MISYPYETLIGVIVATSWTTPLKGCITYALGSEENAWLPPQPPAESE